MDLYTLIGTAGGSFEKNLIVDRTISVIWTERYRGDSEVTLRVPATSDSLYNLYGSILMLGDHKELMWLHTSSIEDGVMTLTGTSLLKLVTNARVVRTNKKHADRHWNLSASSPAQAIVDIVYNMMSPSSPYVNGTIDNGLGGVREGIYTLVMHPTVPSGSPVTIQVPFGKVYDAIQAIAEVSDLGLSLHLIFNQDETTQLEFQVYEGVDRTSLQSTNPVVRFSELTDTLANVQELSSFADYKNIAYAFITNDPLAAGENAEYEPGFASSDRRSFGMVSGLNRRTMMITVDDIKAEDLPGWPPGQDPAELVPAVRESWMLEVTKILNARASDALSQANNKRLELFDGEIPPNTQYKYGTDYSLGDKVDVETSAYRLRAARITEYIYVRDEKGEREFPSVELLDDPDYFYRY